MQSDIPIGAIPGLRRVSQGHLVRFGLRLGRSPEGEDFARRLTVRLTRRTAASARLVAVGPSSLRADGRSGATVSRRDHGRSFLAQAPDDGEGGGQVSDDLGHVSLDDGTEIDAMERMGEIRVVEVVVEGYAYN